MKPLMMCQWLLALALIIPPAKPMSKWEKRISITAISLGIFCLIGFCVMSGIFFVKSMSMDLESALYALTQFFGIAPSLNIIVAAFFLRHKIVEIFKRSSEIYETCK